MSQKNPYIAKNGNTHQFLPDVSAKPVKRCWCDKVATHRVRATCGLVCSRHRPDGFVCDKI